MENNNGSSAIRRRRRMGHRSSREKTPDISQRPNGRAQCSDGDSSQVDGTTASEEISAQVVRMQIRPPGTLSAHESKILRRRDRNTAGALTRSHSQPRQAERLSSPEAVKLMKSVKRSSSQPRHKEDESTENEALASVKMASPTRKAPTQAMDSPNTNRLEQNLKRFDEERQRFAAEKRQFEKEKRDFKLRHKALLEHDQRKRLVQSYRKLSDNMQLPTDSEERKNLVQSLRLGRGDAPTARQRNRSLVYDESSTQFSSSEADTEDANVRHLIKQLSPVRRNNSGASNFSAPIISRGPPPEPPKQNQREQRPEAPVRKAVSRNNSLSPIRPERRSKTPEQRAEMIRRLAESSGMESTQASNGSLTSQRDNMKLLANNTNTSQDARRDSLIRAELRRRRSLEEFESKNESQEETFVREKKPAKQEKAPVQSQQQEDVIPAAKSISPEESPSFLHKLLSRFRPARQKVEKEKALPPRQPINLSEIFNRKILKEFIKDARFEWQRLKADYPDEVAIMRTYRKRCIAHTILLILLCGFGGLMFRYTEGAAENIYKCEVRKVKRDFIDNLWTVSHNMREDDWKTLARQKLRRFEEELYAMQELGMRRFPGQRSWNFVNCIIYCWTVITTIGYGHITPKTTLGQSLTIIYAIIGVPMFLILLTDFGKLFTRGMKFLWAYVRRVYYTGTCRKIRKQQQVRDAISGFEAAYDLAVRRPSQFFSATAESEGDIESQVVDGSEACNKSMAPSHVETPTSPEPETFEIDDEFNLPVSVASVLLISYIIVGAFVYTLWEDWTYFEAFYFVFISMSTIGFGDFVPNHPIFMMCSILYLIFGLALTSMFINVVQIKLSDSFKQASAKISATIGFNLASEAGEENASQIVKTPSEMASVHGSVQLPQPGVSALRKPRAPTPTSLSEINVNREGGGEEAPKRQVQIDVTQKTRL